MSWIWENEYKSQMQEIIAFSSLAYEKNLVSAAGGNISARCGSNMLITGSNVSLRSVTSDGLILCDMQGKVLDGNPHLRPSKEIGFHTGVYNMRPDINYVIHVHPCFSTIWSMQKKELPLYTESARIKLKQVPVVPEAAPGTKELAQNVIDTVSSVPQNVTTFLLEGHGIIAMGATMAECFNQAELLEDSAKIAVFQRLLK